MFTRPNISFYQSVRTYIAFPGTGTPLNAVSGISVYDSVGFSDIKEGKLAFRLYTLWAGLNRFPYASALSVCPRYRFLL